MTVIFLFILVLGFILMNGTFGFRYFKKKLIHTVFYVGKPFIAHRSRSFVIKQVADKQSCGLDDDCET